MIRYAISPKVVLQSILTARRMFDTDRSGSVNFDEFWSVASRSFSHFLALYF